MTLTAPDPTVRTAADLLPPEHPVQLVDETGTPVPTPGYALPQADVLLDLHRRLVLGRRFDRQATALTKQGRLAVYPSAAGQEAAMVGAVAALQPQDWMFPTYRESVALVTRGIDPVEVLTLLRGDWHAGYDPHLHRTAPQCTPLATQALHAVGLGQAARLRGEELAVLCFLGDGATSEGDTHEALNFAAVFSAPVVFLVQNNGYAISVPLSRQTKAPTLAHKAVGYGMPGTRVDGNDVAAVFAVVGEALERARRGGGPTLVEAHTYRMEAHTNADDAGRYRPTDELEQWRPRDPIARVERLLTARGDLTEARQAQVAALAEEQAASLRDRMNTDPALDPLELFDHVYAEPTRALVQQRAALAAELAQEEQ